MFRTLRADEIECRIQSVNTKNQDPKKWGVILLLYKDARCDQNILDETVGEMNWKKSYQLIDGQLFCTVEIWDDEKKQWVGKQDVGVESNTEEVKGRASDAQKRSCFAWSIGRELYSSPFIWIKNGDCEITDGRCYDKFYVGKIEYEGKRISYLEIVHAKYNRVVYRWGEEKSSVREPSRYDDFPTDYEDLSKQLANDVQRKTFTDTCKALGVEPTDILRQAGWTSGKMTVEDHGRAMIILKEIEDERQ